MLQVLLSRMGNEQRGPFTIIMLVSSKCAGLIIAQCPVPSAQCRTVPRLPSSPAIRGEYSRMEGGPPAKYNLRITDCGVRSPGWTPGGLRLPAAVTDLFCSLYRVRYSIIIHARMCSITFTQYSAGLSRLILISYSTPMQTPGLPDRPGEPRSPRRYEARSGG